MLPLHRAIAISVFEQTALSEDLRELLDEGLVSFFSNNNILESLYEEGIITWQGDVLVLKNKKSKGEVNYWDSISKHISIDGKNIDEWNKDMRGRWTCYPANLVQIGKLLKKGYSYEQIAETLNYVAERDRQFTQKLSTQFEMVVFKQNFDRKDSERNAKLTTGFKR